MAYTSIKIRVEGDEVTYEVLHQPSFSLAVLQLQAEQSIQAESGAMVSMSANVELQSQMKGGLFGAIKRAPVANRRLCRRSPRVVVRGSDACAGSTRAMSRRLN